MGAYFAGQGGSLTIKPNGQTLVVSVTGLTAYSDAARSAAVTFPAGVSSDTTYYFADNGTIALAVTQPDGTSVLSTSLGIRGGNSAVVSPSATEAQLAVDATDVGLESQSYSAGREAFPRWAATSAIGMSSQVLRLTYLTAPETESIESIAVCTNTTAAGATPSLIRFGLYTVAADGALTLVASTASDTTLLAAASTLYTKALSSAYTVTAGTRYCVASLVVTAATAPTVTGTAMSAGIVALEPRLTGSVSGQADLPASVTGATIDGGTAAAAPWVALIPAA